MSDSCERTKRVWSGSLLEDGASINPESLGRNTHPSYRFRYVDVSSVDSGAIQWQGVRYNEFLTAPSRARRPVRPGDVIFGTVRPANRSHGWIPHHRGNLVVSTAFAVIRPDPGLLDSRFVFHFVMSDEMAAQARRAEVGTNYPAVNEADVGMFTVPVPPLPEQRRIAEILDTVDEAIQGTEELIAKLEEMKKGLLHDLLTRGIDENGDLRDPERHPEQFKDSPLGQIPRAWGGPFRLDELEERGVLGLGRGNVISTGDIDEAPGPYPVYSSSAKGSGMFGRYGKYMFEEELITWSIDGGGRPFYRPKHRYSVTNVCGYLRVTDNARWNCSFIHTSMEQQHAKITFDYQMKAHPSVIREMYWFARPNIEEQHLIVGAQKAFSQRIASEKNVVRKLRSLRNALMDDLLTGRVRVRVPEPEEATA